MLDETGRDPPNPTYTCVVKMTPRGQYITWKNAFRERIETSKQLMLRRKSYEIKNLACFKDKFDSNICINLSRNVKFNRFSSEVNLVLLYPRSTNILFGPLAFEPNTSLVSMQIESLYIYIYIYIFFFS